MLKFSKTLLLFVALIFLAAPMAAQNLSKEETKALKTKAKEYRRNLPALKRLMDEHSQYQDQVVSLQQQVNDLQAQMSMKDRQIASFDDQQALLNQRVLDAENKARDLEMTTTQPAQPAYNGGGSSSAPSVSGTIFRVQIGAFQQRRVDADLATGSNMMLSETADGLQKVIVGEFRTYDSARRLRDKMRQIGVKGAFVVASQDGQPIDVKTAVQYTGETID